MDALAPARAGADLAVEMRDGAAIVCSVADRTSVRQAWDKSESEMYSVPMNGTVLALLLFLLQAAAPVKSSQNFHWDWHQADDLSLASSLLAAKLSATDKAEIQKAIEAKVKPDFNGQPEEELSRAVLNSQVKIVHLSNSGSREIIAYYPDWCSPTGNCTLWFF
jgi:hypothetical protein